MFQPWRIKVRQAEEALRDGRLDEASQLLQERGLLEFLPAKRLMARIAQQMTERAEQRFAAGATLAGWQDLSAAERLGAENAAVAQLKVEFTCRGLAEAEAYLNAGDPEAAVARLATLERQGATGREFRIMRDAAAKVLTAQQLCQTGNFGHARLILDAALALRPDWRSLEEIRQACVQRGERVGKLVERLHESLARENWTLALADAEAILELAPAHPAALDARRRAWAVVGGRWPARAAEPAACGHSDGKTAPSTQISPMDDQTTPQDRPAPRYALWVDGVGGFLVCRGDVVSIGQPVPGSYVDVPVLGDISRQHARIRRDGESYLLEPIRTTRINGQIVDKPALLTDGDQIELGDGVRMRFRLPNPLSRTARLDFLSRHRTQPTTDGVLLMAESCILGPMASAHIVCRDWPGQVVLFPRGEGLHCRASGRFQVDGTEVVGEAPITSSSQIVGEDFSLSLENV